MEEAKRFKRQLFLTLFAIGSGAILLGVSELIKPKMKKASKQIKTELLQRF